MHNVNTNFRWILKKRLSGMTTRDLHIPRVCLAGEAVGLDNSGHHYLD
jgi:hypothetical protein